MTPMESIFILGTERSGSTWLANIFDSHPGILFYMEPFAEYAEIFPGFPGRNAYIDNPSGSTCDVLEQGYSRLYRMKYPLSFQPGRPQFLRKIDDMAVFLYGSFGKALRYRMPKTVLRYDLLRLNQRNLPYRWRPHKHAESSVCVTKELRLNFKVPALAAVFQKAKAIVTIRHPGAQIQSIMRQFDKGGLSELQSLLSSFPGALLSHPRFQAYWDSIRDLNLTEDLPSILGLWWFVNNEVLIEDLTSSGLQYRIVPHEELSESPHQMIRNLFDLCAIEWRDEVGSYIDWSSNHDTATTSPVDTCRISQSYYKKMIGSVNPALNWAIEQVFQTIAKSKSCEPQLREYLDRFFYAGAPPWKD